MNEQRLRARKHSRTLTVDPLAVMVHFEHATVAALAVVRAERLHAVVAPVAADGAAQSWAGQPLSHVRGMRIDGLEEAGGMC